MNSDSIFVDISPTDNYETASHLCHTASDESLWFCDDVLNLVLFRQFDRCLFSYIWAFLYGFTAHVFISCFCFQLFSDLAVYRVFCLRCLTCVLPHKRQLSYLLAASGCYTTAYSLQSGCPLWRRPHYGDGLEKRHSCTTDES